MQDYGGLTLLAGVFDQKNEIYALKYICYIKKKLKISTNNKKNHNGSNC